MCQVLSLLSSPPPPPPPPPPPSSISFQGGILKLPIDQLILRMLLDSRD